MPVDFGFTERSERSERSGVKPKSTGKLAELFSTHGELAKFRRRRHNRSGYERSEAKQPGTVDPMDLAGFGMFSSQIRSFLGEYAIIQSNSRFSGKINSDPVDFADFARDPKCE